MQDIRWPLVKQRSRSCHSRRSCTCGYSAGVDPLARQSFDASEGSDSQSGAERWRMGISIGRLSYPWGDAGDAVSAASRSHLAYEWGAQDSSQGESLFVYVGVERWWLAGCYSCWITDTNFFHCNWTCKIETCVASRAGCFEIRVMEPCWTAFADDANLFVLLSVLARAPLQCFFSVGASSCSQAGLPGSRSFW